MKCVLVFLFVAGVIAEPPRFRPARFRFQRIELAPTTTDSPTEPTTEESGPYPPSGWKPDGAPFTLPTEDKPNDTYGPPKESAQSGPYPPSGWKPDGPAFDLPQQQAPPSTNYGAPNTLYGAPDTTYGAPTTVAPTTDNPQAEKLDGPIEVQKSIGTYFVLLPNGQLQKVKFVTENDIQNMKYTARLQLADRAPLLVFGP